MRTHHLLLAGNALPHRVLTAMQRHPDIDPSAITASNVHRDQALALDDGGRIGSEPGEHRINGSRHLNDAQTDRRRQHQPQNRGGRHHDADDLPVMICIGTEQQHHATRPDARLLN